MRTCEDGCNGCDECTDYDEYDEYNDETREPPEFGCCLPPGECCMPGCSHCEEVKRRCEAESDLLRMRIALTRLWPALERAMSGLVFTADRAGEVQADMNTLRAHIKTPNVIAKRALPEKD